MIKDWFNHGSGTSDNAWLIPLPEGDDFPRNPMVIPRTPPDPTRPAGATDLPTFINHESPWWDGSQLYGTSLRAQHAVRTRPGMPDDDGKLKLGAGNQIPYPHEKAYDPRQVPGFWLGLSLLARVFALEHNAICDRLRAGLPELGRRDDLPARAADQRRAAGQDPHDRVDPGGDLAPDDGDRHAGELVRPRRRADLPHASAA